MAKKCPITNRYVLYLDCLECEDKSCRVIEKSKSKEKKLKPKTK